MGKACGGYRDLTNLIFKNETANVTRRASSQSDSGAAGPSSITRPPTPEVETTAKRFFFTQFVTPSHLAFLEGISPDEFLLKPIVACALAARANLENDEEIHELARSYYVDSITATNTALRHPRRVKEDNTLVAVCLLSVFEVSRRITLQESSTKTPSFYLGSAEAHRTNLGGTTWKAQHMCFSYVGELRLERRMAPYCSENFATKLYVQPPEVVNPLTSNTDQ